MVNISITLLVTNLELNKAKLSVIVINRYLA